MGAGGGVWCVVCVSTEIMYGTYLLIHYNMEHKQEHALEKKIQKILSAVVHFFTFYRSHHFD